MSDSDGFLRGVLHPATGGYHSANARLQLPVTATCLAVL